MRAAGEEDYHRRRESGAPRPVVTAQLDVAGIRAAAAYRPAGAGRGIGCDWHDVIALPSGRVALVVGDAAGRGPAATATAGRLHAAVRTLAGQGLAPDDLLDRLDDLVLRLEADSVWAAVGSSCLVVVCDPDIRRCVAASAGHPPPALVHDGVADYVPVVPRLPLGVRGPRRHAAAFDLAHGSVLALYTDGLLQLTGDVGAGVAALRERLAAIGYGADLEDAAAGMVGGLPDALPPDDATLLLACP